MGRVTGTLVGIVLMGVLVWSSFQVADAQTTVAPQVTAQIARARLATAKYAMDVERAKADGYMIITQMIPNMGYHFLNPKANPNGVFAEFNPLLTPFNKD